jgi:hypothetical protein
LCVCQTNKKTNQNKLEQTNKQTIKKSKQIRTNKHTNKKTNQNKLEQTNKQTIKQIKTN